MLAASEEEAEGSGGDCHPSVGSTKTHLTKAEAPLLKTAPSPSRLQRTELHGGRTDGDISLTAAHK